ncbi:Putative heavy-metal-binding [Butyrivibrio sp. INlla16]|nr:heavy metal-binding domain-containing protein [Butyrivibrio sp. INlla16]SDB68053.1 Putative heavy-metal-binding [Butyrivibrio sp. INlla16]
MMGKARELATDRMIKEAQALGADAIVGVRYSSSSVMQSAAEIMAYGTAVKFV